MIEGFDKLKDTLGIDVEGLISNVQKIHDQRVSFPKDKYGTQKNNIVDHDEINGVVILNLSNGKTKELPSYTWQEVENIIKK